MALSQNKESREKQLANLVPFKKGQVQNPGGKPPSKKLITHIRQLTDDGVEMASTFVHIMRGGKIPGVWGHTTYADVMFAAKWLDERLFGKNPNIPTFDTENQDIRRLLYVELTKKNNEEYVEATTSKQSLESKQPLPDKDKR